MSKKITIYLLSTIFISCSGQKLFPPSQQELLSIKRGQSQVEHSDKNKLWAIDFWTAKERSSCSEYIKLSNDEEFPLSSLAQVRAIKYCPLTKEELGLIWSEEDLE